MKLEFRLDYCDVHLSRTMHYSKKALEQIENALEYAQAIDPKTSTPSLGENFDAAAKTQGFLCHPINST
jgi:hypothetical protein